jgi:hypothetical protein
MFHVGQHVVCVRRLENPLFDNRFSVRRPTVGNVYTVLRVAEGTIVKGRGIELVEIGAQRITIMHHGCWIEGNVLFTVDDFRPLSCSRLDVFRATLTKTTACAEALKALGK